MRFLTRSSHSVWAAVTVLLVAQAGLLVTFDLAANPVATMSWLAVAFFGWVWAAVRLAKRRGSLIITILAVAAVLRLLAVPLPPTLSDDILRYIWDGKVAGAGLNPYLLAPEARELEPLRDDLWQRLPHRDVETVYPALAISVFSIAARLPAPIHSLKLLLMLADLGTCYVLVLIARRLALPESRVVWYAWSPLAVLEVAGMGHVDGLGILAASLAVLFLVSRPPKVALAGVAAAGAILAKVVPLVAVPLWARHSGRPLLLVGATVLLCVVASAPAVLSVGGVPPGYLTYGVSWEFNGPLFEPLWRLLDSTELNVWIESTLDQLKLSLGHDEFWNRIYPFNYPQFIAKVLLGVLAAGLLVAVSLRAEVISGTGLVFGILVLCSATVYPWYVLWTLPWAAICRQPAWLLLSATIPVSYWPQVTGSELMPWSFLAIWTPFVVALVVFPRWSTD